MMRHRLDYLTLVHSLPVLEIGGKLYQGFKAAMPRIRLALGIAAWMLIYE